MKILVKFQKPTSFKKYHEYHQNVVFSFLTWPFKLLASRQIYSFFLSVLSANLSASPLFLSCLIMTLFVYMTVCLSLVCLLVLLSAFMSAFQPVCLPCLPLNWMYKRYYAEQLLSSGKLIRITFSKFSF